MILAALHDEEARRQLSQLGEDADLAQRWCAADGPYGDLVRERARRAVAALGTVCPGQPVHLDEALVIAASLFDAGLFFETHELLEPHWRQARADTRRVLQGLIQIAVGYQHWVHGNVLGARALLRHGAARLRGCQVCGIDFEPFAAAVSRSSDKGQAALLSVPTFPRRPGSGLGSPKTRQPKTKAPP